MRIAQFLAVFIVAGFISLYLIALSSLLFPSSVFVISLIFLFLLILGICIFGDKVLLSLMKAKPLPKQHSLYSMVNHYSFLFQQEQKKIYLADHCDNCFLFKSIAGPSTLVIDQSLIEMLSSTELEALIFLTCVKSKGKKLFLSFVFQMLRGLFYSSLSFLPKTSKVYRALNVLFSFFLFPLRLIEVFAFKRGAILLEEDFEVFNKSCLGKDLTSAYFKIEQLYSQKSKNRDSSFKRIIEGLAILEDHRYDALRTLLGPRLLSKGRFKALIHEKFNQKCDKNI